MQLNFQAPTVLKTHITNVPALQLTLTPQAPETSTAVIVDVPLLSVSLSPQAPQTLKTSITSVPALDIALTPQAPSTLRSLITDVPARSLTLTPQAPETTHTVPGTNVTDVPVLSISLTPQAPATLRSVISSVPSAELTLAPQAPETASSADEVSANTGGWEQRKQRDILRTETTEERRRRIRAAREALGIIEPVREIAAEQLPDEDIDAPPGESVEALQARLEIVLEALDRQQAINVRKRKAAAVLLLAV